MPRLLTLLIGLVISALLTGLLVPQKIAAAPPFSGGEGTKENPYKIETVEELNSIRGHYLDRHFRQAADLRSKRRSLGRRGRVGAHRYCWL